MGGTKVIQEISFEELKQARIENPDGVFYICAQAPKNFIWFSQYKSCSALTPNAVKEYRNGLITKGIFQVKYKNQLKNPVSRNLIRHIKVESKERPVYLVTDVEHGLLLNLTNEIK
jgi:hypothetical protein